MKRSTQKIKNMIKNSQSGCYIKEIRKGAFSVLPDGIFSFSPTEEGYEYLSLTNWDRTQLVDEHIITAYNGLIER